MSDWKTSMCGFVAALAGAAAANPGAFGLPAEAAPIAQSLATLATALLGWFAKDSKKQ